MSMACMFNYQKNGQSKQLRTFLNCDFIGHHGGPNYEVVYGSPLDLYGSMVRRSLVSDTSSVSISL
jgi:hypothetical protein